MSQLRTRVVLALMLAWCALAQTAAAQPSAADKAAAEALFKQGRALADQERYAEACPKFAASQQLDAGLGTLLHLANCYEKQGKLASAWATFEEAASVADTRGDAPRAELARVRAAALQPQLAKLVVEVPTILPEGFEVQRNGIALPAPSFGVPLPVDPGSWLVRASAPGYEPFEQAVNITPEQSEPYIVRILPLTQLAPAATNPAPEPPPLASTATTEDFIQETPRQEAHSQRTLGLIVGSAGIISGVISGIFTVMALSSNNNSKDLCDPADQNLCSPEGVEERDQALTYAAIATGAGAVGIVGVGVGATLFFTAPRSPEGAQSAVVGVGGSW